jgi:uncharacterized membrane protein YjjP (DUF1212 family)
LIVMEQVVDLVLSAGELLLSHGAEMYRVEETIEMMGQAAGFSRVEVFATPTGLFLSLHSPDGPVYTRVRRIRRVRNNLSIISEVNAISRRFFHGQMSMEEVRQELETLHKRPPAGGLLRAVIGGFGAAAFALMYAGSWGDALLAGAAGMAMLFATTWFDKHPVPTVLQAATGSVVATAVAVIAARLWPLNSDLATLGAVMLLAPGVVMTTAIRDMFSGELVSGVSRSAEALAIAVAIATGVAVVLTMGGL